MKKALFLIILCLLCACAFADSYPFGVVVYPTTFPADMEVGPMAAAQASVAVSNAINDKPSMCSITFNKNNPYFKQAVEDGVIEESDLADTVSPDDAERIATGIDCDGYAFVECKSFTNDFAKDHYARGIFVVSIYKNGVADPIFSEEINVRYDGLQGYWRARTDASAFEKICFRLHKILYKKLKKLNGFKYKELKVVQPLVDIEEDAEE
ncbi:MAG: hypothetical protein IJS60_04735 [Abditibacteriota bacterium]|nr:hypothetical protein [Abditibacteriota bacterium]